MKDCPTCGAPVDGLWCKVCGEGKPAPEAEPKSKEPSERSLKAAAARQRYLDHPPSSADLTAQQWYNVCKFFPNVARRAGEHSHRPLAVVGADNPLDRTAQRGPLLAGFRLPMREPGEEG